MPTKSDNDLLRPIDIAREYRIGRNQVRRLVNDGTLPHVRNGPRMLIPRWAFNAYITDRVRAAHP
jgi:excisionase family DNA binding protein